MEQIKTLWAHFNHMVHHKNRQALVTQSTLFSPANIYDVNGISFHGDQTYQRKQKQKRLKTDQVKIEEILKEVTTE